MAIVVNMPRLSDTMEEGVVAQWLKNIGDSIEEGDILAEIETDKATMEFESFNEGTLLHIGVQEGESAPVDTLLAIIGDKGEDISGLLSGATAPQETKGEETKTEETPKKVEAVEPIAKVEETKTVSTSTGRIFASPLAKKIASDKGINLADLSGSGDNGRITKKDVEGYSPAAKVTSTPSQAISFIAAGEEKSEEVKNSQMRKAIAKSLGNSKFSAPDFSLNIEVDMDNAMASRKTINAIPDTKVSFNDMVVKACAMALVKHPQVNTSWTDNNTVFHSHIHVGVAVAVDDGLLAVSYTHLTLPTNREV